MYIGEWENNYPNGLGKDASFEKDYDIFYYEGNFMDGKYNGTFRVTWEYQKGKSNHITVDYENGKGIEVDLAENEEDYRSYYHLKK